VLPLTAPIRRQEVSTHSIRVRCTKELVSGQRASSYRRKGLKEEPLHQHIGSRPNNVVALGQKDGFGEKDPEVSS
jgi:hypothetical protein